MQLRYRAAKGSNNLYCTVHALSAGIAGFAFLQHLDEETEEHEGGDSGGDEIGYGFSQEHSEGLILEEDGQDEDHGDQQENL